MPKHKITPKYIADHIRRVLKDGGSAPHAEGVQKFFKEEIQSRGWHTDEMRKVATRFRRAIVKKLGSPFLVQVADNLFRGRVLEEKVFAVLLLERLTEQFGEAEFWLFESWLKRISSWADHDGLVYYLIAPMIVAKASWAKRPFVWAKSKSRWHRRAACVALILMLVAAGILACVQAIGSHVRGGRAAAHDGQRANPEDPALAPARMSIRK